MAFQIAGDAVANNARLCLTSVLYQNGQVSLVTYTNASGVYTFTSVPSGDYWLTADLLEVTAAPYNTGYKYPNSLIITMDVPGNNLVDVNLAPVLKNASNVPPHVS
jgi:hypothetical protein